MRAVQCARDGAHRAMSEYDRNENRTELIDNAASRNSWKTDVPQVQYLLDKLLSAMFYICCVNTEHLHCLPRLICVFIKGANDNWYSTVIFKMQIQLCLWQTRSHPQGRGAARKLMSCTQACEYTSTWPPLHQYRSPHVMQPDKKIKMVATRHISLSRTIPKCFCGRLSSAPDPIEEPYRALQILSLIHIWRCRRSYACRSRWSPYH